MAGDDLTGVYRSKSGKLPLRVPTPRVVVEAYSWGALTSRASNALQKLTRIAWIFLLPFALLNLAYWSLPTLDGDARLQHGNALRIARSGARIVRVSGILLTAFFVLTPLTVGVNLVAWQCYRGGNAGCPVVPDAFGFLASDPFQTPQRRIAVGMMVPILVIAVLALLSRQSLGRYESVPEPTGLAVSDTYGLLRHPRIWAGASRTRRLRNLHIAFALCVVGSYTGIAILAKVGSWHGDSSYVAFAASVGFAIVIGLVVIFRTMAIHVDDIENRPVSGGIQPPTTTGLDGVALLTIALVIVATQLALLCWGSFDGLSDSGNLIGENTWFITVLVLLTALHASIFFLGRLGGGLGQATVWVVGIGVIVIATFASSYLADKWSLPRWVPWAGLLAAVVGLGCMVVWQAKQPASAIAWSGAAPSVFLAASVWVALLFTTAVLVGTANWLNGGGQSVEDLGTTPAIGIDASSTPTKYVASGKVVIRRANVLVTDEGVTVRSGTFTVDSLYGLTSAGEFVGALGDRRFAGAEVAVPTDGTPLLSESCVTHDPASEPRCSLQLGDRPTSEPLQSLSPVSTITVGTAGRAVDLKVNNAPQTPLTLPQVLIWAPIAQLLWVVLVLASVMICWFRLRMKIRRDLEEQVDSDNTIAPMDKSASKRARLRAAFTHRAERLIDPIGAATGLVSFAAVLGALTGRAPWELDAGGWTQRLANLGLWAALAASAALIWLAARMRRSEKALKAVGILWDLTTFWPRAAHPFAPPCYAERVVPELLVRVKWALCETGPDATVVVSAHSQGSALAVAALSRLDDGQLERVRLITYGSQIRAWYGRIFPAVFGPDAVGYLPTTKGPNFTDRSPDLPAIGRAPRPPDPQSGSLHARMSSGIDRHWINLFRRTDPIGFRVFSDEDDLLPDVYTRETPGPSAGDPGAYVRAHGWYMHSPEYRAAVRSWTGEPEFQPGPPTLSTPFIPPG